MMTEAWRGFSGATAASSVVTRSSPPKRSFDVAFLTGVKDPSFPEDEYTKDDPETPPKMPDSSPIYTPPSPSSVEDSPRSQNKVSRPQSNGSERGSGGSAFTKVFKSHLPTSSCSGSAISAYDIASSLSSSWPPSSSSFTAMSSLLSSTKALSPLIGASSFLPPALMPLLNSTSVASSADTLVEEYLKSQHEFFSSKHSPLRGDISTSEALSRLRSSMMPPVDSYKISFAGLPYALGGGGGSAMGGGGSVMGASGNHSKISSSSSASFITQNSVSALMPPTLSQLALPAQNVCAKCNISFRMTSDLVYHMRSQHKREPDPYVRRRNQKLKCPICAESFRERHHLTRHMTAHQDRAEEKENK